MQKWTASLTYSKSTDSHAKTQIHGVMAAKGYSLEELRRGKAEAEKVGLEAFIVNLRQKCESDRDAYVLVMRNVVKALDVALPDLTKEYAAKIWPRLDRHLVVYNKILNKHARGNAELGPQAVESTYCKFPLNTALPPDAVVTGIVIPFVEVPLCDKVGRGWERMFGDSAAGLRAEVNHYGPKYVEGGTDSDSAHRVENCGIGFHGDSERKDVICLCLGTESREVHFQAYKKAEPVGERYSIKLEPGDGYVMDEVACGSAWKYDLKKEMIHYRHAAGSCGGNKFIPSTEKIIADKARKRELKEEKKAALSSSQPKDQPSKRTRRSSA